MPFYPCAWGPYRGPSLSIKRYALLADVHLECKLLLRANLPGRVCTLVAAGRRSTFWSVCVCVYVCVCVRACVRGIGIPCSRRTIGFKAPHAGVYRSLQQLLSLFPKKLGSTINAYSRVNAEHLQGHYMLLACGYSTWLFSMHPT